MVRTGLFLIDPDDITISVLELSSAKWKHQRLLYDNYSQCGRSSCFHLHQIIAPLLLLMTVTMLQMEEISLLLPITNSSGNDLTLIASDQLTSSYGADISLTGNLNLSAGPGGIQTIGNIDIGSNTLTSNSGGSAIYVGDVTAGNLSLTTTETGSIIQSTKFKGGELNLTTNNGNVEVTATTGDLSIASVNLGTGAATIEASSGTINDSTNDSIIDLTAGSATLSATSIGNSQPIEFGTVGTLDLTASTGTISSNSAAPSGTSLTASAVSDSITFENTAGALEIASLSSGGAVSLTTSGAITQTGAISNNGQTITLAAGLSNDITLSNSANDFGTITITTANNVSLRDLSSFTLNSITDSQVAGNLTLQTAGGVALAPPAISLGSGDNLAYPVTSTGTVTDSGSLVVPGTTSIMASGQDVILDDSSNNFGTIGVTGANVSIQDTDAIDLAASTASGTFDITSGGVISNSGALIITGASTFNNLAGWNRRFDHFR